MPGTQITINLENQSVTGPDQTHYPFVIDTFDRMRLLQGLDDISMTQRHQEAIESFEAAYRDHNAWAFHY